MHLAQNILREYLDDFVIVFIDNILIFSIPLQNMLNTWGLSSNDWKITTYLC